jgi:hypothetical protein
MPPDHAERCLEEMRENAEVNGACEALPGMIWDSAYPPQKGYSGGLGEKPQNVQRYCL